MNFAQRQKGLGAVGWLFMILVFGGVLTVGTKLFPYYLDNSTMDGILDEMAEIDGLGAKRTSDIKAVLIKRFKINGIRDFPIDKNIDIKRNNEGVQIVMDYKVTIPLVYNVDLLASFHKSVRLRD